MFDLCNILNIQTNGCIPPPFGQNVLDSYRPQANVDREGVLCNKHNHNVIISNKVILESQSIEWQGEGLLITGQIFMETAPETALKLKILDEIF